jgi:hypothetical protein
MRAATPHRIRLTGSPAIKYGKLKLLLITPATL